MMDYEIKKLKFQKKEDSDSFYASIQVHDILNLLILIEKDNVRSFWNVTFSQLNNYKGMNFSSEENVSKYTKCGFKTFEEAEIYANKEYHREMNSFISSVLVDIGYYIDEIISDDLYL